MLVECEVVRKRGIVQMSCEFEESARSARSAPSGEGQTEKQEILDCLVAGEASECQDPDFFVVMMARSSSVRLSRTVCAQAAPETLSLVSPADKDCSRLFFPYIDRFFSQLM